MPKKLQGFTLIELLLTIAIMAMLTALPLAINATLPQRVQQEGAQANLAHTFRLAQHYAMQGRLDSSWGVYVQAASVTIFKGDSYATRDASFDYTDTYDSKHIHMTVTAGSAEVVFAKLTGIPSTNMSVRIQSVGDQKSVVFTSDGALTLN